MIKHLTISKATADYNNFNIKISFDEGRRAKRPVVYSRPRASHSPSMHGMSWEWLVSISPLNIQGMSERQHKYPEYHGSGNLGNFTEAPLFPKMKLDTTLGLQPCILLWYKQCIFIHLSQRDSAAILLATDTPSWLPKELALDQLSVSGEPESISPVYINWKLKKYQPRASKLHVVALQQALCTCDLWHRRKEIHDNENIMQIMNRWLVTGFKCQIIFLIILNYEELII